MVHLIRARTGGGDFPRGSQGTGSKTVSHTAILCARLGSAAAFALMLAAACDNPSGVIVGRGGGATVDSVRVTPDGRTVQAGATLQFAATGITSAGDTTAVTATWNAEGGTITSSGLFTAGQTAGTFSVIGRASVAADTVGVTVTVPSPDPTLAAVIVTPETATVGAGGAVQFSVTGRLSNGASQTVPITWTSTGGIVSGTGTYTAGALPGTFRVVATGPGGLADSAAVTITGSGTP